jgi:hypothetical protein
MSNIQRTLIDDDGERVVLRYNHYLGLVFVAFAAIPMLVPFKSSASELGTLLTSIGAAASALFGVVLLLRRHSIALDFRARRFVLTKGFWPRLARHEAPLSAIRTIDVRERGHGRRQPTFEVRLWIDRENEAFSFFESPDRQEALDVMQRWRARLEAAVLPSAA